MTEAELQETVREIAKTTGWLYYHTYRSKRSPAGFPDVVLVRPPRVIFAELKSDTGKLTKEQRTWIEALLFCGEAYVWRPKDLELISAVLSTRYARDLSRYRDERPALMLPYLSDLYAEVGVEQQRVSR